VGLAAGAIWLAVAKLGRMSSLASLISFAAAPLLAWFLADWGLVVLSLTLAVLIFARHHTNIRRLLAGTEPHIGQGGAQQAQG
jgi:glycerol-3-phosphate acyltransferase PlsY